MSAYEKLSKEEIMILFRKQLVNFIDELIDSFPSEGNLVIGRIYVANQLIIEDALNGFCNSLTKYRESIRTRDVVFFREHNLLGSPNKDNINYLKKLWDEGTLDDEEKLVIWEWVDLFVTIADTYSLKK